MPVASLSTLKSHENAFVRICLLVSPPFCTPYPTKARFHISEALADVPRNGANFSCNETMERCVCSLALVGKRALSLIDLQSRMFSMNGIRIRIPFRPV